MNESAVAAINERAADEFYKKAREADKEGNKDKALDFYERALNENPDHEPACFELAVLYDRQSEDSKAIELYERICTSEPVHINALLNLSILYEDNNMYDDARRCLLAVVRTDPNHQRANLYLKDVESARSMFMDDDDRSRGGRNQMLEMPITDFELSVRSRNCLKKMDLRSIGDLLRVTETELLSFKNFGETSLAEIKALLASRGLRLGQQAEGGSHPPEGADADAEEEIPNELHNRQVMDLELSVRSRKALQRLNINTVGELVSRTEDELLGCKNFGHTSLNEIKQVLATIGISLRKLDQQPPR